MGCMSSLAASRQAVPGGGSHFGGPRFARTTLWCSIRGCAAELAARCALRSNSRGESVTKRALRANPESVFLAASEIAPTGHRLPRSRVQARHRWRANSFTAKACAGTRQCASKALSSTGVSVGARSALRALTRCGCLSGARKARAASSAARPNPEQRKAVAEGDRFSEALTGVRARLCRVVQRAHGA